MDRTQTGYDLVIDIRDNVADDRLELDTLNLVDRIGEFRGLKVTQAHSTYNIKGAKAVDATEVGTLLVLLGGSLKVIPAIIGVINTWLHERTSRTAKVTVGKHSLELRGITEKQQTKLIESWLEEHGKPK